MICAGHPCHPEKGDIVRILLVSTHIIVGKVTHFWRGSQLFAWLVVSPQDLCLHLEKRFLDSESAGSMHSGVPLIKKP